MRSQPLAGLPFVIIVLPIFVGCKCLHDQSAFPKIICQPVDQVAGQGWDARFTVKAKNGALSYQWYRNSTEPIKDATTSTLTIKQARVTDAGFYECELIKQDPITKETEKLRTRAATLFVMTSDGGSPKDTISVSAFTTNGTFLVYGPPTVTSGGAGTTCPGPYVAYVNYKKALPAWGWSPSTAPHTAADPTGRTDTKVEYSGSSGDRRCANTTVSITPLPPGSAKYRFTIYFPSGPPTTNYPIRLTGFNP